MTSTRRSADERFADFVRGVHALAEPQGEGAYALDLSRLHEQFQDLSQEDQAVAQSLVQHPDLRRLIAFS